MQNIISIGDKLDMELLIHGEPETDKQKRRVFNCRIMDMPDGNVLRITMPFYEGRLVPLETGTQYRISTYAQKGIYEGDFVVVDRMKDGNLFMADMELQGNLKKVQRREYYRYGCRLEALYRLIAPGESIEMPSEEPDMQEWKKAVILDISGGGIRMVSEYKETTPVLIQMRFTLPVKDQTLEFLPYGNLLSSAPNVNNPILQEHHVMFAQLSEKEREQIIGYIFEDERRKILKNKGLE